MATSANQPQTISELQKYIESELDRIGIDKSECRAETELILLHLTHLSLAQRIADPEREVSEEMNQEANRILERRRKREPLQYCLGESSFFGRRFLVKPGVLIPRPDTETLVQSAFQYFGGLPDSRILHLGEIGCGSGVIAITLLKLLPNAIFSVCDISDKAIELTKENAELHAVADRLVMVHADWHDWLKSLDHRLDGIVTNPPYIPPDQKNSLEPEVEIWEPAAALFGGGNDGLDFYRDFAENAGHILTPQARAFLEIGFGQANLIRDIFQKYGWRIAGIHKDLNKIDRVLSVIP